MKVWKSLIVVLLSLFLLASVALAQNLLLRDVDTTIEIVEGPTWLGIYDSAGCITDIMGWRLEHFQRGTYHTRTFYLRNDGVEPITFYPATIPQSQDLPWGTINFDPSGNITLLRNQVQTCAVTIWVDPDAATGNYTFQLRFYEP